MNVCTWVSLVCSVTLFNNYTKPNYKSYTTLFLFHFYISIWPKISAWTLNPGGFHRCYCTFVEVHEKIHLEWAVILYFDCYTQKIKITHYTFLFLGTHERIIIMYNAIRQDKNHGWHHWTILLLWEALAAKKSLSASNRSNLGWYIGSCRNFFITDAAMTRLWIIALTWLDIYQWSNKTSESELLMLPFL